MRAAIESPRQNVSAASGATTSATNGTPDAEPIVLSRPWIPKPVMSFCQPSARGLPRRPCGLARFPGPNFPVLDRLPLGATPFMCGFMSDGLRFNRLSLAYDSHHPAPVARLYCRHARLRTCCRPKGCRNRPPRVCVRAARDVVRARESRDQVLAEPREHRAHSEQLAGTLDVAVACEVSQQLRECIDAVVVLSVREHAHLGYERRDP